VASRTARFCCLAARRYARERKRERNQLQEDLARLGGGVGTDAAKAQADYVRAEKEAEDSEKALGEAVKSLGLALGMSRLSPAIVNRLRAEELRESWEGLKRGTLESKEKVLGVALPEPPETDPLLGNIAPSVRLQVRQRFADALDRIKQPAAAGLRYRILVGSCAR
jgi:hypothetical protein